LVIVNKFTKFAHFIPLAHPYIASSVASAFMSMVYKFHGLLAAIIFYRDPVFISVFWQSLFKLSGTELKLRYAYHPQTDGQTKHVNQCLETFLRCFVHACPRKCKEWLPTTEFWYNTCMHSALGHSQFEALFGRQPRLLGLFPQPSANGKLDEWLKERANVTELIRHHLTRAQFYMKKHADKHHNEHQFTIGDMVYMKLQPYAQSMMMPSAN
jgi:hypothetical protein